MTFMLLLVCGSAAVMGQSSQPFNFVASPMLSQSSRVSSNLSKFTGRLGLTIPIYSYKSPSSNLALNVALGYSGGGLNILQNVSSVGAGWNLMAGGSVFRSINGLPDDRPTSGTLGYFYESGYIPDDPCCINYQGPGDYPDPVQKIHQDGEEDDYYFDLNGRSGKLLIPQDILQTGSYTAIQTIPQSTVHTYLSQGAVPANASTTISEIVMTDESGIEYHFGAMETMQKKIPTLASDGNNNYHYNYAFSNEFYVTAWRLTKMIDVNTQEEIDFNYTSYNVTYKVPDYQTTFVNLGNQSYMTYDDRQDTYQGTQQRLTSIQIKNGDLITFVYDTQPRLDFVSDEALIQIQVTSAIPGNQITYNLKQSYIFETTLGTNSYQVTEVPYGSIGAGGGPDRLGVWFFLKGITQEANDGSGELPIASFGYFRNTGTESSVSVPNRFDAAPGDCDNWGNASQGNQNFFGALDTVFNVNGGYTYYQQEYNDYNSGGTTAMIGGLRVKSITQTDGVNHSNDLVTNYTYQGANGVSSGFTTVLPPNYYQNSLINSSGGTDNYAVSLQANTGVIPAATIQGSPVGYSQVVESVAGYGKTVYQYTSLSDYAPLYTSLPYPYPNMPLLADWAYGLPKMTTVYDANGLVVRTLQNVYNVTITPLTTDNYRSMKMAYKTEAQGEVFGNLTCAAEASAYNFQYQFYYPTTGITQMAQTIATDYPANGKNLVNTTVYTYDPTYYTLTSTATTDSKGETITKIPFYLFQTANTSSSAYGYASAYNLLTSPYGGMGILTKTDATEYIISYSKINYEVVNGMVKPQQTLSAKLVAPVSVSGSPASFTPDANYGTATTALSVDASYDQYDAAGTILQASDPSHNKFQSEIWDYAIRKQVAQCNTANPIDYTSFENNQLGNWTVVSGSVISGGITGAQAFSGTLAENQGLSGNFTLTLWSAAGTSTTVNGQTGTTLLTRNGYQLQSWSLSYGAGNPGNPTISGTNFDEVRLYPQGAQMSTCTYSPLVGITSTCDANNRITYYDYDIYDRLKDVRDQDGNIIRTLNYHYQGN